LAEIRQKVFEEKSKTLYNIKETFSLQSVEGDDYLNKNTPVDAAMQDLFEYIKDKQSFDNAAHRIIFPNMTGKATIQPYSETKSMDDKIDETLKFLKLNRSYLEKLEAYVWNIFNLKFDNKLLLIEAFVHRSWGINVINNERLEFLGDSVINFMASSLLFQFGHHFDEATLSMLRKELCNNRVLSYIGVSNLKIHELLLFKEHLTAEVKPINRRVVANAVEALIGGIYVDKGIEVAANIFNEKIITYIITNAALTPVLDPVSKLHDFIQKYYGVHPKYSIDEIPVTLDGFDAKYTANLVRARLYVHDKFITEAISDSSQAAKRRVALMAMQKDLNSILNPEKKKEKEIEIENKK